MKRLILVLLLLAGPVWAVEPHEMLDDPALEARAQQLDQELRCVKCQSEALASSNAKWAADARVLLRQLLSDGYSDQEVLDFFVVRYGEYVLMEPKKGGTNTLLWYAGPIMLLLGFGIGLGYLRRRNTASAKGDMPQALSSDESARLAEIMKD
jgi:cytochrome c-type biogenesis protein CcmH